MKLAQSSLGIGETKVPSPLGAAQAKDQCERVGHLVAFGNTEEWLHRAILGSSPSMDRTRS